MKNFLLVLIFVAVAALSWGVYGPVLREGQAAMEGSHLRPFVCVGIAYFFVAILVPGMLLASRGENGQWTPTGTLLSLAAGAAGAIGALGVILAFTHHGNPVYVMPLVFGGAPVVNTFLTMYLSKNYEAGAPFYAGLILVVVGAVTVLSFKPGPAVAQAAPAASSEEKAETADEPAPAAAPVKPAAHSLTFRDLMMVTTFVALTVLSWGIYGPILHRGQAAMQGSRLRPLICVGVSYFVIAVVVPVAILATVGEHGGFSLRGTVWSLGGGVAGAVGALGIIMAFNFGGRPVYVMPLVFGGAPVVNTLVTVWAMKSVGIISPLFYAGLIVVVAGAACVLVFAPKPGHGGGRRAEGGGRKGDAEIVAGGG